MPSDLTPEQQQAQRAFAAATGLPVHEPPAPRVLYALGSRVRCVDPAERIDECGTVTAITATGGLKVLWDAGNESWTHDREATLSLLPRVPAQSYEARACDSCEGSGHREELDGEQCSNCDGVGRTVVLRAVQDGGELLAPSVTLLAQHLRAIVINDLELRRPELPGWLLDRLALHAYAAEQLARRDHAHVVELNAALELERVRFEDAGARLRQTEHDLAALHEHCKQLSDENEELRSENGALRVEAEAGRVAVQEATDAVLDAGVKMSIELAESDARDAGFSADEAAALAAHLRRTARAS